MAHRTPVSAILAAMAISEPISADSTTTWDGEPGDPLIDRLPSDTPTPEQIVIQAEEAALLWSLVGRCCSGREEFILRRRFVEGQTLEEIGGALGICRERARQLQENALRKLRRNLP